MICERYIEVAVPSSSPLYSYTSKEKFLLDFEGHEIVGVAPDFNFADPNSISDNGQRAILIEECRAYVARGGIISNIAGTGIELRRAPNPQGDYWNHTGRITGWSIRHCRIGVHLHNYAEYETLHELDIHDCSFGILLESGNACIGECDLSQNYTAFRLWGGPNNGHGIATGCFANHCVYPVHAQNITLGFNFRGLQACGGYPGGTQATLAHINSKLICYDGGQFSFANITVDADSSVYLDGVALRGNINVTLAPGAIFKAHNCKRFSDFAGTINGNVWDGSDV
jgi:hypothetical protein